MELPGRIGLPEKPGPGRKPALLITSARAIDTLMARPDTDFDRAARRQRHARNDDMFVECAAIAKADLLVSDNKDLLTLGTYKGTRIVKPSEYPRAG